MNYGKICIAYYSRFYEEGIRMSSLLQSTRNTRVLPTGEVRYIRSDVPKRLTGQEIQWLLEHHVTTLVDLRSEEEAAETFHAASAA